MAEPATAAGAPPPPAFDPSKPFKAVGTQAKPAAPAFDPSKPYKSENLPMTPESTGRAAKGQSTSRIAPDVAAKLGYDPDVNYVAGSVPLLAQATLKTADNPEEAKAIMEHFFGKGNYGQDKGGRWWARVGGQKVAMFQPYGGEIIPGLIGTAPITAGAIMGGVAGSEFGPGGSVVGAGAGGALGKAVDEARKAALGEYKKTASQEVGQLALTAVENAAFEAGGQIVGAIGRGVGPFVRRFVSKPTAEGAAMTDKLLKEGARPPLASAAPGAKVFQYDQMLRNLIKGNPQEARNVLYIQGQIKDMLKREGIPDAEIETMMQEVSDTSTALSTRKAGEAAVAHVSAYRDSLAKEAETSLKTAQTEIDRTDKLLRAQAKAAPGDLSLQVAEELRNSRAQFGARMNAVYDHIDRIVGGAKVIPTFLVKRAVKSMTDFMDPQAVPPIFREIAAEGPAVSIAKMQRYRTRLREMSDGGLLPNIDQHMLGDAATAADASFDQTFFANPPETRPLLNILRETFGPLPSEKAVALLRKADTLYRQGIAKYKDAAINKIVRDAKSGIPSDPRYVAAQIVDLDRPERAKTILSLLTPQTQRAVAAADMQNIVTEAARRTGGDGSRVMSGDSLLKVLDERGKLLDIVQGNVYGTKYVGILKEQAKRLAALDGKVDISALQPGRETLAIEDAIQKTQALDEFIKKSPVSALTKGAPEAQVDRAIHFLTQPGNEAQLEAAVRFFGPQSDVVMQMRKAVMKDVLSRAMVELPSRARTVGGSGIDEALSRYTAKQQELLFPDGLLEDMKTVAKEAKFLFPWDTQGKDFGGSLAAAEIKGHVPFRLSADLKFIEASFFGWFADREGTIRLLSTGLRQGGPAALYAKQSMKVLFRSFLNSEMAGPGRGAPQTP